MANRLASDLLSIYQNFKKVADDTARDALTPIKDGDVVETISDHRLNIYHSGVGWEKLPAGTDIKNFASIKVAGQSDVISSNVNDALTFEAGNNIILTTNPTTKKVKIDSSGGGSGGGASPLIKMWVNTPPTSPNNGDAYLIGSSPTGLWLNQGGKIATYSSALSTWIYKTSLVNDQVLDITYNKYYFYNGTTWVPIDIPRVADDTLRDAIQNPYDGQVVSTLSDHRLNIYNTNRWNKMLSNEPGILGNWSYIDKKVNISELVIDWTVIVDGDLDERYMIEISASSSGSVSFSLQFNDDVTNGSYKYGYHQAGYYNSANLNAATALINSTNIPIGSSGVTGVGESTVFIDAKSGKKRIVKVNSVFNNAQNAAYWSNVFGTWENLVSNITKIRIFSNIAYKGTITLYKWQDAAPRTLHSYELVKEYKLTSTTLDDSFDWSGRTDDVIKIVYNVKAGVNDTSISLLFNYDSSLNYDYSIVTQDGSDVVSNDQISCSSLLLCDNFKGGFCIGESNIYTNNIDSGNYPCAISSFSRSYSDNLDARMVMLSSTWKNSSQEITNITLQSSDIITGIVRVYRLCRTYLTDTQINKYSSELSLPTQGTWDGKLGLTIDTKSLYVYDVNKSGWRKLVGDSSFGVVKVPGQLDVQSKKFADTLNIVPGTDISIDTDPITETITINSTAALSSGSGAPIPIISVLSFPPNSPNNGDKYIVGQNPTDTWVGQTNNIAVYNSMSGLWNFTSPSSNQQVLDLSLGYYKVYETSKSAWKTLSADKSFVDPKSFGNWILAGEKSLNGEVLNWTIDVNGDVDRYYRVVTSFYNVGGNSDIYLRFNNDSSSTYYNPRQYGGTSTGGDNSWDGTSGFIISNGANQTGFGESFFDLKSGKPRTGLTNLLSWNNSNSRYTFNIAHYYGNGFTQTQLNIPTSKLTFVNSGANTTGKIQVYKWQELKPVELHSYELVKELVLSGQIINDGTNGSMNGNIIWDGDNDDVIYIVMSVDVDVSIRFNNDATSNYAQALHYSGQEHLSMISNSVNKINIAGRNYSVINGYLKKGSERSIIVDSQNTTVSGFYRVSCAYKWKNITNAVNMINLATLSAANGNIRIYKLAKTHLLSTTPNYRNGLYLTKIDDANIHICAGEIEINGTLHILSNDIDLNILSNIRSGESFISGYTIYVYAIFSSNRTPSFKFSVYAPLIDRYGNIVTLDDIKQMPSGYYHPMEGITWRCVGYFYYESNIVSSVKTLPYYSNKLEDIVNVSLTSPQKDDILKYDNGIWKNYSPTSLNSFTGLSDVPQSYVNQGGKYVSVSSDEDELIFTSPPDGMRMEEYIVDVININTRQFFLNTVPSGLTFVFVNGIYLFRDRGYSILGNVLKIASDVVLKLDMYVNIFMTGALSSKQVEKNTTLTNVGIKNYFELVKRHGEVCGAMCSSANGTNYAYKAFNGLVSSSESWMTISGTKIGWIQYTFADDGFVVNSYQITVSSDTNISDPKTWTLLGSNDYTTWVTLDSQTLSTAWNAGETKMFNFINILKFKYYRLNITVSQDRGTSTSLCISNIILYSDGVDIIPTKSNVTNLQTFDLFDGNVHDITLKKDTLFNFVINDELNGNYRTLTLVIHWSDFIPDIEFASNVKWQNGTLYNDYTPNTVTFLNFFTIDDGVTWYGLTQGVEFF